MTVELGVRIKVILCLGLGAHVGEEVVTVPVGERRFLATSMTAAPSFVAEASPAGVEIFPIWLPASPLIALSWAALRVHAAMYAHRCFARALGPLDFELAPVFIGAPPVQRPPLPEVSSSE